MTDANGMMLVVADGEHLSASAREAAGFGSTWKPAYEGNLCRALGSHLSRWEELASRARTPVEDRQYAVLQWSADFTDPATAYQHAEAMPPALGGRPGRFRETVAAFLTSPDYRSG